MIHTNVSRRKFLAGSYILLAGTLAGCSRNTKTNAELGSPALPSAFASMYGPLPNEQFPLPAINLDKIPERFLRREIAYQTNENVGTIIVDTKNYFLYLIQENGRAIRYGVGLGRAGFEWSGRAFVARKAVWPTWTPPEDMIARQPELEQWSWKNGGMPAGLDNPLGARALYIYQGSKDTLYRLHGTAEIWSIGKAVSSGCVRMLNQDIIDLHRRVPNQTPIVVL
ncbi:L,D-transpeptidase [Cohaesibacter sp. CAU 1516]|uniref:L,D-transpeptidase n=1 Tax=Cohaesibacter sp. CAU 1516 TaxID=2576038 RepID=UPI0010FE7595|nr:L,D-transpeptidase [Cohaesibacter sp. CAU 1516]TLP41883.1 L,D-transpeptidase [Cohaesibacter sp. CAU 1516]